MKVEVEGIKVTFCRIQDYGSCWPPSQRAFILGHFTSFQSFRTLCHIFSSFWNITWTSWNKMGKPIKMQGNKFWILHQTVFFTKQGLKPQQTSYFYSTRKRSMHRLGEQFMISSSTSREQFFALLQSSWPVGDKYLFRRPKWKFLDSTCSLSVAFRLCGVKTVRSSIRQSCTRFAVGFQLSKDGCSSVKKMPALRTQLPVE